MNARPLSSLLLLAAVGVALPGCESPTAPAPGAGSDLPVALNRSGPPLVTLPFRATLFTDLAGLAPGPECAQDQLVNTQVGEGTATHLGRFSVTITFCVNVADLGVLADGQLTEGESLPYSDGVGVLTAANGDELHMEVAGTILPSQDPDYDFQFIDPFSFVGGTGRFADASGHGMTESYVDFAGGRTDHGWTGVVVVRPGR